ncbi:MAG: hypothetical protein WKF75_15985 [Singulisphaera sp.]
MGRATRSPPPRDPPDIHTQDQVRRPEASVTPEAEGWSCSGWKQAPRREGGRLAVGTPDRPGRDAPDPLAGAHAPIPSTTWP